MLIDLLFELCGSSLPMANNKNHWYDRLAVSDRVMNVLRKMLDNPHWRDHLFDKLKQYYNRNQTLSVLQQRLQQPPMS